MSRARITLLVLAATAAVTLMMAFSAGVGEPAVEAEFVTVTSGRIADMAAITGRLAYTDETIAYADAPGLVAQVYVSPGDRVAQGDALLRLDASAYEAAVTAWLANDAPAADALTPADAMARTVVRAPVNGTVRQVLAGDNAAVAAGSPVVILTSTKQELRCTVAEADARRIRPGMWARLSVAGEDINRPAWVTSVGDVEAEKLTGATYCTITLAPEQHIDLPGGAAVDADVYIAGREDVPILPLEAITERGTVWWVSDARCTEIPVEIILSDEMHAWVDLPEGVAVALGEFKEGQRVTEVRK